MNQTEQMNDCCNLLTQEYYEVTVMGRIYKYGDSCLQSRVWNLELPEYEGGVTTKQS
jgi:hypothetical protein